MRWMAGGVNRGGEVEACRGDHRREEVMAMAPIRKGICAFSGKYE